MCNSHSNYEEFALVAKCFNWPWKTRSFHKVQEEKDGVLPFLDVLVRRRDNGELTTSTDTLQMLSFNNNHPQTHKRSCVKTLFKRVETHCSTPEAKKEEIRYLKLQFSPNNYPNSFIKKDSAEKTNRHHHGKTEPMASSPLHCQHLGSRRPPPQALRSRSCPSSSRNITQMR